MSVRTVAVDVLRDEGWETVEFAEISKLLVEAAPGDGGLTLTLIGTRSEEPNVVETGVLDVAERHRELLDNEFPEVDGESLPLAQCANTDS